jgi:hypothetical protein
MIVNLQTDCTSLPNGKKFRQTDRLEAVTGILLFTSTGELLFMNHEAQAFIRQLQPRATRENGAYLIPADVHLVVRDLISRLMECEHPKDCESIQFERLSFADDTRMLLRGICIPDVPVARNSRLLIIMEKLNQKFEYPDANIQ